MKISDYKIGTHFITREGVEYVLMPNVQRYSNDNFSLSRLNDDGWLGANDYDDDYRMIDEDDDFCQYDIAKIVQPMYNNCILLPYEYHKDIFKIVWERPEARKMTKAEIEAELGYVIEIVD